MFSGIYFDSGKIVISVFEDFKKNGYITCNVQDICHKELMSIGPLENYLILNLIMNMKLLIVNQMYIRLYMDFLMAIILILENAYMEKKVLIMP